MGVNILNPLVGKKGYMIPKSFLKGNIFQEFFACCLCFVFAGCDCCQKRMFDKNMLKLFVSLFYFILWSDQSFCDNLEDVYGDGTVYSNYFYFEWQGCNVSDIYWGVDDVFENGGNFGNFGNIGNF